MKTKQTHPDVSLGDVGEFQKVITAKKTIAEQPRLAKVVKTKESFADFIRSETGKVEMLPQHKAALERGAAPISERGVMAIRFGSKGYTPTGAPKKHSGFLEEIQKYGKPSERPTTTPTEFKSEPFSIPAAPKKSFMQEYEEKGFLKSTLQLEKPMRQLAPKVSRRKVQVAERTQFEIPSQRKTDLTTMIEGTTKTTKKPSTFEILSQKDLGVTSMVKSPESSLSRSPKITALTKPSKTWGKTFTAFKQSDKGISTDFDTQLTPKISSRLKQRAIAKSRITPLENIFTTPSTRVLPDISLQSKTRTKTQTRTLEDTFRRAKLPPPKPSRKGDDDIFGLAEESKTKYKHGKRVNPIFSVTEKFFTERF